MHTAVGICGHCDKQRVLVGVVRSEYYVMEVCTPCAIVAARLTSQHPRGDGQITVESLASERQPYTDRWARLAKN
jgi:hypothetical protein